jgi:hypothetical protein
LQLKFEFPDGSKKEATVVVADINVKAANTWSQKSNPRKKNLPLTTKVNPCVSTERGSIDKEAWVYWRSHNGLSKGDSIGIQSESIRKFNCSIPIFCLKDGEYEQEDEDMTQWEVRMSC